MRSIFSRVQIFFLALVLALGMVAGANQVRKAYASSPPTMTWGTFTGSITGGGAVATIGTGATGVRLIVQYADMATTAAGIVVLYEQTSAVPAVLKPIATFDCAAAGTLTKPQNDYFGGTGYVTGSGSSLVILTPSTLTVTGNVRYLAN